MFGSGKKYANMEFDWDAYWEDIRNGVPIEKRLKKRKKGKYYRPYIPFTFQADGASVSARNHDHSFEQQDNLQNEIANLSDTVNQYDCRAEEKALQIKRITDEANHELFRIISTKVKHELLTVLRNRDSFVFDDGVSLQFKNWLNTEVDSIIDKASSELESYNTEFIMDAQVAELYACCKTRLETLEKNELMQFAQDYLDELEEAGFKDIYFSITRDVMAVYLTAITPEGIPLRITGCPCDWDYPPQANDPASFLRRRFSFYEGCYPGQKPEFNVSDSGFKHAFRGLMRAVPIVDWCDAAYSLKYALLEYSPQVDFSGESSICLYVYGDSHLNKRCKFDIYFDPLAFKTIANSIFDASVQVLKDGSFNRIEAIGNGRDKKITIAAVDNSGMKFLMSVEVAENCEFTASNLRFRECMLGLTKAVTSVDWINDSAHIMFQKALESNNLVVHCVDKTGLCTFSASAFTEECTNPFEIKVRIDRQDFIVRRNAADERRAVVRNHLRNEREATSLRISSSLVSSSAVRTSDTIDNMSGLEFEELCAELLRANGYSDVEITPGSGDQGIDIVAEKDFIKYGFQCKCYSAPVGNKAVQEAFTGKSFYRCHIAIVLTNNRFTSAARELADKTGVVLWDRNKIFELIESAEPIFS